MLGIQARFRANSPLVLLAADREAPAPQEPLSSPSASRPVVRCRYGECQRTFDLSKQCQTPAVSVGCASRALHRSMLTAAEAPHSPSARADHWTVYAIDDEEPMRNALRRLLLSSGFAVQSFASASEFLAHDVLSRPACILLDLNMPGMNGLELQQELHARGVTIPVVFLTGAGTVGGAVTALRAGAVDFVEKPFSEDDLLNRVNKALEIDRAAMQRQSEKRLVRQKVETLTPREKEVLSLIAKGLSNKLVARKLDLSPRTVEGYRARIMEKLAVNSVADLVRLVQLCEPLLHVTSA